MNNSNRTRGCSPLPPELNRLARKKHYEPGRPVWMKPQDQWLSWGRHSKKEGGTSFDEYFPPVQAIEHSPRSTMPSSPFLHFEQYKDHCRIYEKVVREIGPLWTAGDDVKPILIRTRDALKEKVLQVSKSIAEPVTDLKNVFKVWVAEAERKTHERPPWSKPDPRLVEGEYTWRGVLLVMVQRKWKWLTSGHEPAFLEPRFPEAPLKLFSIFGVSEPLDRAQKRELRFHAERISKVVREKQPVIAKWRAYEKALDAVLRDEPIPEWEKVKAELESQQSAHNTSKTHHKRTLHMGKKVHEYRRKHGHDRGEGNPHLWQASKIRDWLRKDMINPDTGKPYSQGTLLKAAQETGCWVNTKQGSAAGLEESLDNLENYYLKHRQKSEKEV